MKKGEGTHQDALLENAFRLGKLVQLRQIKDGQFTERAEQKKKEIEEQMGDIIEQYPELEDFLPYPICYR